VSEKNQTEQEALSTDELEAVAGGASLITIMPIICPGPIILDPCPPLPGVDVAL
jgi:hypothetical protein